MFVRFLDESMNCVPFIDIVLVASNVPTVIAVDDAYVIRVLLANVATPENSALLVECNVPIVKAVDDPYVILALLAKVAIPENSAVFVACNVPTVIAVEEARPVLTTPVNVGLAVGALLLNVDQSVDDNAPLFNADAVGTLRNTPAVDVEKLISVPVVVVANTNVVVARPFIDVVANTPLDDTVFHNVDVPVEDNNCPLVPVAFIES